MSIDFSKTFGKTTTSNASKPAPETRPKSQFWLNIGYDSGVVGEDGKSKFVSLPAGIPLDGQERLPTNSRNAEFSAFQSARNNLMEQIQAAAEALAPGEEKMLNLQIQLRRINDDAAELPAEQNAYVRNLGL